jgi:hypothetical protein
MLGVGLFSIMGNFSDVTEFMDEIQVSEITGIAQAQRTPLKEVALANCEIYTP